MCFKRAATARRRTRVFPARTLSSAAARRPVLSVQLCPVCPAVSSSVPLCRGRVGDFLGDFGRVCCRGFGASSVPAELLPGPACPRMGDVVSSHLDEAKRQVVAGEELFLAWSSLVSPFTGCCAVPVLDRSEPMSGCPHMFCPDHSGTSRLQKVVCCGWLLWLFLQVVRLLVLV